jgi:hypothetical protein
MFQVQRKMADGEWYEVMLSPFKTLHEVYNYLNKYMPSYPQEDRVYKILNISNK